MAKTFVIAMAASTTLGVLSAVAQTDPATSPAAAAIAAPAESAASPTASTWRSAYGRTLRAALLAEAGKSALKDDGMAMASFSVDEKGKLLELRVVHHFGMMTIDDEVRRIVETAAKGFPAPPPGAGAAPLSFSIPITFK